MLNAEFRQPVNSQFKLLTPNIHYRIIQLFYIKVFNKEPVSTCCNIDVEEV